MAGKNCVGINALSLADRVDLAKHVRTAAVVTASSAVPGRRCITKRRMVPKWIVKLVVVILRLTKVINNVSQMIKEGGSIRSVGRSAVACHLVSHANLVSVLSFV